MVQSNVFAARNYEMSACLLDLINLVDHIFQSTDYCTITKGELVHKILANSFDITERSMFDFISLSFSISIYLQSNFL